jgi:hypothetical protein
MRTVDFSRILSSTWGLLDGGTRAPADEDFQNVRDAVHRNLYEGWRHARWPQLALYERRYFRDVWASGTAYSALDQVYYPAARKYYQALQSSTGEAPADASEVENSEYWAELKTGYTGNNYAVATTYAAGTIVYYATTNEYYQCHSATTGNDPTNTSYWGLLVDFIRSISFSQTGQTVIGDVHDITDCDPRVHTDVKRLAKRMVPDAVVVLDEVVQCWVKFQAAAPELFGDVYDATVAYAVGDQIYFKSGTGDRIGNFYNCIVATSAGESPSTTAASWSIVEMPLFLEVFLQHAAYKDLAVTYNKDPEMPVRRQSDPLNHLENELLSLARQGHQPTVTFNTR